MHVIHNQFNFVTMTSKFNPKAVSIFPKNKTLIQTINSTANVTQSVTLVQYVDKHDMLDHFTRRNKCCLLSQYWRSRYKHASFWWNPPLNNSALTDKQQDNGKKISYYEATPVKTNAAANTSCQINVATSINHSLAAPIITPQNKEFPSASRSIPSNYHKLKIYSSPFLTNEFKPLTENINLTQELEPLRSLILSQHEVFTEPIKDLGSTNLFLTKIIEKKKNSYNQIKNHNKTPRSLRIKCELTTSPSYTNDEDFLKYKEELQTIITDCIKKGTNIMSNWAEKNIKLLTLDHCSDISFIDSDWATNTKEMTSKTSMILMYSGGAIGYKSKFQTVMTRKGIYCRCLFCRTYICTEVFVLPNGNKSGVSGTIVGKIDWFCWYFGKYSVQFSV